MMTTLHPILSGSPYQAYVYAYPHKTAYRAFREPLNLNEYWTRETCSNLFLYLHVPFCTMRCGFCNLFTQAMPTDSLTTLYLDALTRQAEVLRSLLPQARFSQVAIGGGTPTFLNVEQLQVLFGLLRRFDVDVSSVPSSVEVSPDTITSEKAAYLRDVGVERISIGIQSFVEQETAQSGRPQSREEVEKALQLLTDLDFPTLNIDLIYGLPNQTVESWLYSLEQALRYEPEELYLYPLYVRPLTGLGRSSKQWDDVRLACYRSARDRLLSLGYVQFSMRKFRKAKLSRDSGEYCCQRDGMLGLGCGARSYTRQLHYSLDYAVTPKSVKQIISDYLARDASSFQQAEFGFLLNEEEQRRRYLLQSILNTDGLLISDYRERFGTTPEEDFPILGTFAELGLLTRTESSWTPTSEGLERSDALGPWLFSEPVQQLMKSYELR
jgi:oxygen-independent coproporphyrinogen III oxidase